MANVKVIGNRSPAFFVIKAKASAFADSPTKVIGLFFIRPNEGADCCAGAPSILIPTNASDVSDQLTNVPIKIP